MKTTLWWTWIGIMLLFALSGAAILIGRAQPRSPILPDLQPCGNSLCVFGIELGKTSFADARAVLERRFDNIVHDELGDPPAVTAIKHFPPVYSAQIRLTGPVLYSISLIFPYDTALTAAEVVIALGEPCAVRYNDTMNSVWSFSYMEVEFHVDHRGRVDPALHVSQLLVYEGEDICATGIPLRTKKWMGFADYRIR